MNNSENKLKWYIAVLLALAGAFCVAAPNMALSVLFEEIAPDLNLNLVQVGVVWGFGSLFSMVSGVVSGALGDTIGPKRVILIGILSLSLAGAARGLTHSFPTMLMAVSAFGFGVPMVTISAYKLTGMWFPKEQLGFANGIFGTGMSLGFFTGALISATVLSPWLGGWRKVMFFYGAISAAVFIIWLFSPSNPTRGNTEGEPKISMRRAYAHTIKLKEVWLIGIALLGVGGCLQGIYGYLPLFLRGQGWEVISADGALSLLHGLGVLTTIPLTLASDRFRIRKQMVTVMLVMLIAGTLFLT
ncbi:MAG: MFS transporter, partial [Anaerolineales bacterium]